MRGTLPNDILYRRKMGFVSPIAAWFRGPLYGDAQAMVTRLARTGWFVPAVLDEVLQTHRSGARDHSRLLWQLVMFEKAMSRVFGQ